MAKKEEKQTQIVKKFYRPWMPVVLGVLVLILAGVSAYFYIHYAELKKDPKKLEEQENKKTVQRVSKLMLLPTGEEPTIATVLDAEKLKQQPFFSHAKVGDKVLIFSRAGKAILYDPQSNKIVDVAPMNLNLPAETQAGSATSAPQ